jgi:uncharacterized protein YceK
MKKLIIISLIFLSGCSSVYEYDAKKKEDCKECFCASMCSDLFRYEKKEKMDCLEKCINDFKS